MDDLTVFKRRVGYKVKADQDTQTATGDDRVFTLRFENVFDVVVLFGGEEQASGYEVDGESGVVTFTTAPPSDTVIVVNYKFAPFTDDEANALIAEYGLSGRAASKSRDHGWVVRRHAETGVFVSGVVDIAGGCGGCGGQADLR